ncbi:peptidyl-prolyl cis-trans isomerase cyclophilin type [Paludibacter propionicigenes WB4]|uniref:peptidylprolyl isomerase n=2 Tax=Paludibacter TaxID=346096 RepID=E4T093_PALPW|nr:peptidyl-prolyl cis-trans isomerase cyclophilin type [Paludibacter propionicigenes WB4]
MKYMRKTILLLLFTMFIVSESCVGKKNNGDIIVRLETTYGTIKVKLYPETVKHRDNFLKLVNAGYYNGVLFHRVIANFMIQAGDPKSKTAQAGEMLGSGDVGYTIPAEFIYPQYYHKRGALAAAREGDQQNPKKASSGCQFYIVQGKKFTDAQLDSLEGVRMVKLEEKMFQEIGQKKLAEITRYRKENNQKKLDAMGDSIMTVVQTHLKNHPTYKYSAQQRNDYKTLGGSPHLDGNYTVFGEVIDGLNIVDKIANATTDDNDRPIENIKVIKATVEK